MPNNDCLIAGVNAPRTPLPSSLPYDPKIASLVAQVDDDWGDPAQNRANIIQYGIPIVDKELWGVQFQTGELIGVQGAKKMRKTTFMANIILNIARQSAKREAPFWINIDTLESGLPPKGYRDMLIAILATWSLLGMVYEIGNRNELPSVEKIRRHPTLLEEMHIAKRWLRYATRSKMQFEAIERAKEELSGLPIVIFGPAAHQGAARKIQNTAKRWQLLYHGKYPMAQGCHTRLFCADNIQQYDTEGQDYARMGTVVNVISNFIASHLGTVGFCASQLSVSSATDEQKGFGEAHSRGGWRFAEECNVLFRTKYDKEKDPHRVPIQVDDTRDANVPRLIQEIDFRSGAFLRHAITAKEYQNRPGWER